MLQIPLLLPDDPIFRKKIEIIFVHPARTIQKLSLAHPALLTKGRGRIGFHNFRIVNVFASCALAFDVRLREFAAAERAKDEKVAFGFI